MTDWADEIEGNIADAYAEHGAILAADGDGMISKALRKARADGMREAANEIDAIPSLAYFVRAIERVRQQANQIEKGE